MRLFFENLEALKKYMANEIETYVKAWKSDFYKYDVKEIGKINDTTAKSGKESIFFWVVRENGTFLQSVVSKSTEEVRHKRAIIHQFPTARFYIIRFRFVDNKVHYVFENITARTLEDRLKKISA